MKRLTKRNGDGFSLNHDDCPKRGDCYDSADCVEVLVERLAAYEDAEERELLVQLPCKVGDTVYVKAGSMIHKGKVESISIAKTVLIRGTYNHFGLVHFAGSFGNSVFATRKEAEAALAKEG